MDVPATDRRRLSAETISNSAVAPATTTIAERDDPAQMSHAHTCGHTRFRSWRTCNEAASSKVVAVVAGHRHCTSDVLQARCVKNVDSIRPVSQVARTRTAAITRALTVARAALSIALRRHKEAADLVWRTS